MGKFFLFLTLATFVSCGSVQKRNADLVVSYENKVIYSVGPSWNTQNDLHAALEADKRPLLIVFSANWCSKCKKLRKIVGEEGWRDEVLYVNIDERWVQFVAREMGVRTLPTMLVLNNKSSEISKKISGWSEIAINLMQSLGQRR